MNLSSDSVAPRDPAAPAGLTLPLMLVLGTTTLSCTNPDVLCRIPAPSVAIATRDLDVRYEQRWDGTLEVRVAERDPETQRWQEQELREQLAFKLAAVDARGSHELWIAGATEDGDDLVELWTRPFRPGGRTAAHPVGTIPIGAPLPASALAEGVWPSSAAWTPTPETRSEPHRRERLFTGRLGGIADLAVDPDARFVLLLAGSPRTLYELDLLPRREQPTPLLDARAARRLAGCNRISLGELEDGARIALATDHDPGKAHASWRVVLVDENNDGIFESHESFGERAFQRSRYAGKHWTENFFWYAGAL